MKRLALLFALTPLVAAAQPFPTDQNQKVRVQFLNRDSLMINFGEQPMPEIKVGPKTGYKYPYLAACYGSYKGQPQYNLKFRIYSEDPFVAGSKGEQIARYLILLWNLNVLELQLDHAERYSGIVDVYLTNKGKAGGEQFFGTEDFPGGTRNVNVMYVYDYKDLGSNLELMRVLSHEYGHAALPPFGGFKAPEQWANGHMGERLYMHWMLGNRLANNIGDNDLLGVPLPELGSYLRNNVGKFVQRIMDRGLDMKVLAGTSAESMNEFLGLMLTAEGLLPRSTFVNSFLFAPKRTAMGYLEGLKQAINETSGWQFNLASRQGKATWIPTGKATVKGAKVLERMNIFTKVIPQQQIVTAVNPAPKNK
ncbi:MAG: hypothetical protein JNJ45_06115 [Chthonomonas sp.]|nr:hypothetical protein [Chthonomonas sp.]